MIAIKRWGPSMGALCLCAVLVGCIDATPLDTRSEDEKINDPFLDHSKRETIFGEGGMSFFGNNGNNNSGGSLGVNSFLWRASLDTLQDIPISSVDPFGGVILSDWFIPPQSPNERLKVNIFILDRTLRADGIRVGVFRQVLGSDQVWRDAEVPAATRIQIEDAILTKARQMRHQLLIQENG